MKKINPFLEELYGPDKGTVRSQTVRYRRIDEEFIRRFGNRKRTYFSTPGRTELGGNHTDHNHGRVLAASINLDMAAVSTANELLTVSVYSEGYPPFIVDLEDLSIREDERGSTAAMIRGVAAGLKASGYTIGGFDAVIASDVLPGSGLSSSAAVEVLFGTIFNALFNGGKISSKKLAIIGQYSENKYFGKPCGLMDQLACAIGGIVAIDFQNPKAPEIEKPVFDFRNHPFDLVIVDTGGNHLDLTGDYAGVPAEMKTIARFFNAKTLRDVQKDRFLKEIPKLRESAGDRAILRAFHFFEENDRVSKQVAALSNNNIEEFLSLSKASGDSSIKWLQNAYSTRKVNSQGMPLALAMTEKYLSRLETGACRVHGGGFAGAIQVILPTAATKDYLSFIENILGPKSTRVLSIRPHGTCFFDPANLTLNGGNL